MADVVKLNDDDLDSVSGGAFNFFTRNGNNLCYVDNIGSYYVSSEAFGAVAAYAGDVTKTAQEVVDWAIANGYFSKSPF